MGITFSSGVGFSSISTIWNCHEILHKATRVRGTFGLAVTNKHVENKLAGFSYFREIYLLV